MRVLRRIASGLMITGVMLIFSAYLVAAGPLDQAASEGGQIYQQKCVACHTIGGGKLVGPDLKDVAQRREADWLKRFISAPDQVIAEGDAIALQLLAENNNVQMPNPGLSAAQVEAVITFLENPGDFSAQGVTLPAGDARRGEALFTGRRRLTEGGTSCIACHNIAGTGLFGGGSLGLDLTHVFQRYGGTAGLGSALVSLPFPTMQGVFAEHPLTAQEQADLLAYFQEVDGQFTGEPASLSNQFWMAGIVGAVVLFGIMAVFWPRQRGSVSERLRKKAGAR